MNFQMGEKMAYLYQIRAGLYGAFGAKHANFLCLGIVAYNFGSWADNAEHTFCGIEVFHILLLYSAQRLSRGGIASQDDQGATHLEHLLHTLPGILMYGAKRAVAIGRTGGIA